MRLYAPAHAHVTHAHAPAPFPCVCCTVVFACAHRQVVRVTDDTVKDRLLEFSKTEASNLTPEEFETMETVCTGALGCTRAPMAARARAPIRTHLLLCGWPACVWCAWGAGGGAGPTRVPSQPDAGPGAHHGVGNTRPAV